MKVITDWPGFRCIHCFERNLKMRHFFVQGSKVNKQQVVFVFRNELNAYTYLFEFIKCCLNYSQVLTPPLLIMVGVDETFSSLLFLLYCEIYLELKSIITFISSHHKSINCDTNFHVHNFTWVFLRNKNSNNLCRAI